MPSAGIKPGNVPTARVGPILDALIRERWPYGGGHEILAEKVGCEQSTIAQIIEQKWEGVEFDLADSLLCALGRWDIWHGALEDIYPTKFWSTCELPGCDRKFPEYQRGVGTPVKRFCSRSHTNQGWGVRSGKRPGHRYRQRNRCNKGHILTPENTIVRRRADRDEVMRNCKKCERANSRERQKRYRARKRAARAAA